MNDSLSSALKIISLLVSLVLIVLVGATWIRESHPVYKKGDKQWSITYLKRDSANNKLTGYPVVECYCPDDTVYYFDNIIHALKLLSDLQVNFYEDRNYNEKISKEIQKTDSLTNTETTTRSK